MNAQQALAAYRDIVVVNADHIALDLGVQLRGASIEAQKAAFAGSKETGWFYLYSHPKHPDVVMETIVSTGQDESIISLYKPHPAFASAGELMRVRRILIDGLASKFGMNAESIAIPDHSRGRELDMSELATGQLIDLLAEQVGTLAERVGSYGGDASIVKAFDDRGNFDVRRGN